MTFKIFWMSAGLFMVNLKNKWTFQAIIYTKTHHPRWRGFPTSPTHSVLLILRFTIVLRNRLTYVKDSCLWMPEFIRVCTLVPNKFGHPGENYRFMSHLCEVLMNRRFGVLVFGVLPQQCRGGRFPINQSPTL